MVTRPSPYIIADPTLKPWRAKSAPRFVQRNISPTCDLLCLAEHSQHSCIIQSRTRAAIENKYEAYLQTNGSGDRRYDRWMFLVNLGLQG